MTPSTSRPCPISIGATYGQLTVVEYAGNTPDGSRRWRCRCSCGRLHITVTTALTHGATRSCGCIARASKRERLVKARAARAAANRDEAGRYAALQGVDRVTAKIARLSARLAPRRHGYGYPSFVGTAIAGEAIPPSPPAVAIRANDGRGGAS